MREQSTNIGVAQGITRGVCRLLGNIGYRVLREFKLTSGRRVDVAGLNRSGKFVVVEVKSSLEDFRSDGKWPEYLDFCDAFYFAVSPDFPKNVLPAEHGLIIADAYSAIIHQQGLALSMNGQRRRAQTLRFARTAADRLENLHDPRRST